MHEITLSETAVAASRHLGEADHHRIWCVTADADLNRFRRLEFSGWLVGWGEGLSGGQQRTRTEVTLFLSDDGRIITSVNLTPGAALQILESPPDCWATFLGDHGSLERAASWLRAVRQHVGHTVMAGEAGRAAIAQARALLQRMGRTTEWETEVRRERAALLACRRD